MKKSTNLFFNRICAIAIVVVFAALACFMQPAIAACVLGGCALAGGRVSILGVLMGTFVLCGIQSFLVIMGVQPQWFMLVLGIIVVSAARADRVFRDWVLRGA